MELFMFDFSVTSVTDRYMYIVCPCLPFTFSNCLNALL